jgi:hypothetical protein
MYIIFFKQDFLKVLKLINLTSKSILFRLSLRKFNRIDSFEPQLYKQQCFQIKSFTDFFVFLTGKCFYRGFFVFVLISNYFTEQKNSRRPKKLKLKT